MYRVQKISNVVVDISSEKTLSYYVVFIKIKCEVCNP